MAGVTITLKNVPEELHRSLKESARLHKRSLNRQAIHVLEESLMQNRPGSTSLRQAPAPYRVGRILVPLEELTSSATDLLDDEQ